PPIAKELPHVPHFANHVKIHVSHYDVVLCPLCARRDELPARVDEITLPVKLTDPPRLFPARPVDRADEILIRHRMRRLLDLPHALRDPRHGRRRIEDNLRPVEPQAPRAIWEVTVVTNVNADLANLRVEHRVAHVARPEIKLLPEARVAMRDVDL